MFIVLLLQINVKHGRKWSVCGCTYPIPVCLIFGNNLIGLCAMLVTKTSSGYKLP